jgi:hypothetical protein
VAVARVGGVQMADGPSVPVPEAKYTFDPWCIHLPCRGFRIS